MKMKRNKKKRKKEENSLNMYLSIITLNVNGLNALTKRHRVAEWIRKQDLPVLGYCKLCCYEHWGAQILLDWCFSVLRV